MRRNLTRRQPLRIQRQHDLIHTAQPTLPLLHNHRLETRIPIPRHRDLHRTHRIRDHRLRPRPVAHIRTRTIRLGPVLLMPEMLGHLRVQRRLQHRLGQLLKQPVRAGQGQPLLLGLRHHGGRQLLLRRPRFPSLLLACRLWTHDVQCHHSPCPSRRAHARRVGPETPLRRQSQ